MALRSAPLLLLVLVMVTLRESGVDMEAVASPEAPQIGPSGSLPGAFSHSLKYFSTAISEPSQGQPRFVTVGYVDDQLFSYYDSNSRKMQPRVSWMKKVEKVDPKYSKTETQVLHLTEVAFNESLEILRSPCNQTKDLHTVKGMYGCELSAEGRKSGFNQYGCNGRDFITFNTENLTWVALNPMAQITQRNWEANTGYKQRKKAYLEEFCIEWLKKYLSYQKEALQRTETPVVTVSSRMEVEDEMEMHVCRVDGFYPREIDASWMRDGEVWLQDTFHGSVAPNADGTYHYWLSVRIDPKERGRYWCHVEHDGLQDPLDLELKEPTRSESNWQFTIITIIIITTTTIICFVLFLIRASAVLIRKRRQDGYKATSTELFFGSGDPKEKHLGKMGPIFITAELFFGSGDPKEKRLV